MFYLSIFFIAVHLFSRIQITLQLIQAEGQSVETVSPLHTSLLKVRRQHLACGMNGGTNTKGQFTVTNSFHHNSFLQGKPHQPPDEPGDETSPAATSKANSAAQPGWQMDRGTLSLVKTRWQDHRFFS